MKTYDKVGFTIPDILRMTQVQYDDLMILKGMRPMYHSEDAMYVTPYNAMEVRIENRKRLTFKEAHSLDDQNFDEWEKSVESEL